MSNGHNPRAALHAPSLAAQVRAQRDLAQLLWRLRHVPLECSGAPQVRAEVPRPAGGGAAPPRSAAVPLQQTAQPTASASRTSAAPGLTPALRPKEAREEAMPVALIAAVVASAALAVAVIGHIVLASEGARLKTAQRDHGVAIGQLRSAQDRQRSEVDASLKAIQRLVAEVRYPHSAFGEAQDLFHARRYADAETAYRAFVVQNPTSRVADQALNNAAVAAAMLGNSTMAAAYVKQLAERFPASRHTARAGVIPKECRRLGQGSGEQ